MSSSKQPRRRRASSNQLPAGEDDDQSLNSHLNATAVNESTAVETPDRPILISKSTASSAASKSSSRTTSTLFDVATLSKSRENTPITPPDKSPFPEFPTEALVSESSFTKKNNERDLGSPSIRKRPQTRFGSETGVEGSVSIKTVPSKTRRTRNSIASSGERVQQDGIPTGLQCSSAPNLLNGTSTIQSQDTRVIETKKPQYQRIDLLPFVSVKGDPSKRKMQQVRTTNLHISKLLVRGSSSKKRKSGWVYILESPECAPGHVKIGETTQGPETRMKNWACCNIPLREVTGGELNAFNHHTIVEKLVDHELHNSRKKFRCEPCTADKRRRKAAKDAGLRRSETPEEGGEEGEELVGGGDEKLIQWSDVDVEKYHDEWFEIDKDTALRTVRKWRDWILIHEPFDAEGKLKYYWEWRVNKIRNQLSDAKDFNWEIWTQQAEADDFEYRMHVWETFYFPHFKRLRIHCCRKDALFWVNTAFMLLVSRMLFGTFGVVYFFLTALLL